MNMPTANRRFARMPEGRRFAWVAAISVLAAAAVVLMVDDDLRELLAPAVAIAALAFLYLVVMTKREGSLPIFEAATFFVLATSVYSIVPLLQFVMSGMECVIYGDYRLFIYAPTPQEFGRFAWRHVLLLASFVFPYLIVRGKRLWPRHDFAEPPAPMLFVIVSLVVVLSAFFAALDVYLGPSVSVYEGGVPSYLQLPYIVQQFANISGMVLVTLKQCLLIVLLSWWKKPRWRSVLLLWIAIELLLAAAGFRESRTNTVILLLTFVVGYHLIVRPIRIGAAFATGAIVLAGILAFGLFRDVGVAYMKTDPRAVWGSPTEFQILYGNAYDIHMHKVQRRLPPVPRQLFFSDFYRLVPSQILPFKKWDTGDWYKEKVYEYESAPGMGFMFGIVAQSVLGYDWLELVLRGVMLALFYAAAHRFWRRYSGSFWATIAYLFVLTWAYYAFRASSFEILYRLFYYLLPTAILVKLLTALVSVPIRLRVKKAPA
ncbi:MAG: hypothetical protein M3P06_10650 [Acidobacteriota bacterium]|nr:hypothetical protein [Acidobacteriota bacterium]